jgi:uncharacterized protein (TIGR02246 family)
VTLTQRLDARLLTVTCALVASLATVPAAQTRDEQEIRTLIARYRTAANARDLPGVMQCYVATDDVLVYDVADAPFRGVEAVRRDWEQFINAMSDITLDFREIEVAISEGADVAYAHFIERASMVPNRGARVVNDNLRTTHIYRKVNGRWLIVHEHKSKSRTSQDPRQAHPAFRFPPPILAF